MPLRHIPHLLLLQRLLCAIQCFFTFFVVHRRERVRNAMRENDVAQVDHLVAQVDSLVHNSLDLHQQTSALPAIITLTNLQPIIDTTEQRQNDAIVSQKRFAQRVHKIRLRQQNLDRILRALGQETLLQDGRQLEERP